VPWPEGRRQSCSSAWLKLGEALRFACSPWSNWWCSASKCDGSEAGQQRREANSRLDGVEMLDVGRFRDGFLAWRPGSPLPPVRCGSALILPLLPLSCSPRACRAGGSSPTWPKPWSGEGEGGYEASVAQGPDCFAV